MFRILRQTLPALLLWVLSGLAMAQGTEAATEVVENPYGLAALWAQGDWVAKGTLLILVLMSMGSWYVIFTKLAEQLRRGRQAVWARSRCALAARCGASGR